jgi:glycosyltransferase involved in cell wall biosynthesis
MTISVLIAAYNAEGTLAETLASVLKQLTGSLSWRITHHYAG